MPCPRIVNLLPLGIVTDGSEGETMLRTKGMQQCGTVSYSDPGYAKQIRDEAV